MLVIDGTFGQMMGNNIHHFNNKIMFNLLTNNGLYNLSINSLTTFRFGNRTEHSPLVNRAPGYFITVNNVSLLIIRKRHHKVSFIAKG